jgi:hypothetical protein
MPIVKQRTCTFSVEAGFQLAKAGMTGKGDAVRKAGSILAGRENQLPVIVPQMRVVVESKRRRKRKSAGFLPLALALMRRRTLVTNMRLPYPASPKIMAKKIAKKIKNQAEMSYSR